MKEFRHRSRDELDKDLLFWAGKGNAGDYDALVNRLILEVSLDLRDQNERIIALLERQPKLMFIPTTADIHAIISEIKAELNRNA